jgi:hypothetical protein
MTLDIKSVMDGSASGEEAQFLASPTMERMREELDARLQRAHTPVAGYVGSPTSSKRSRRASLILKSRYRSL